MQTFIKEIITEIILKLGWLKAIAGFVEDPGSIVSTHISGLQLPITPVPRDLVPATGHTCAHN